MSIYKYCADKMRHCRFLLLHYLPYLRALKYIYRRQCTPWFGAICMHLTHFPLIRVRGGIHPHFWMQPFRNVALKYSRGIPVWSIHRYAHAIHPCNPCMALPHAGSYCITGRISQKSILVILRSGDFEFQQAIGDPRLFSAVRGRQNQSQLHLSYAGHRKWEDEGTPPPLCEPGGPTLGMLWDPIE